MRKKRILFSSYYGTNDIANMVCGHVPFSLLEKEGVCEIIVPPVLSLPDPNLAVQSAWWTDFRYWMNIDVAYVHRPYGFYGGQIMKAAKMHDVPTWVHHDDDLLAIPESNPYYQAVVGQDIENPSVEDSYRNATFISCQSILMHQQLREKYGRNDAVLIPISLDDRLLHLRRSWTDNNRICWRGSDSHRHDLLAFKVELQAIFDKYQDKEFHFFILNPRELGFKVKNLVMHPGLPMWGFYKRLCEINASYALVLLEDNYFNRVKSHLAWLDHALGGSNVYAPSYEEFDRDGVVSYRPENFINRLDKWLTTDASTNEAAQEQIQSKYLNSITNLKRKEILASL